MKRVWTAACIISLFISFLYSAKITRAENPQDTETNLTLQRSLEGSGLTEDEIKWLKEKEKEVMKQAAELITAGMEDEIDGKKNRLKVACQYMIRDVKDWSAFAGKLSTGDYRDAVNLLATAGGGVVNEVIEDALPDGSAKNAYKFIISNAEDAKEIAKVLMNSSKSWGDVQEVLWDRLQAAAKKKLEENTDKAVTSIINYIFGDKSYLGYTVGDAYLLILKTEIQVIDVWGKRFFMDRQNELYGQYKELRDRGDSHNQAWTNIEPLLFGGRYAGPFSYATGDEVGNMFAACYGQDGGTRNFGWWLRSTLQAKMVEEKKKLDLEGFLQKARTELQKSVNGFFTQMRRTAEGLMERHLSDLLKKKRAAAITKANQLLGLLVRTAAEITGHCKIYEASHQRLLKIYEEIEAVRKEISALPALVADARKSREYLVEVKNLSNSVIGAEKLLGEFTQTAVKAEAAAMESCKNSERISQATAKDQASKLMNQSVNEARNASKEMAEATKKDAELKAAQNAFSQASANLARKYSSGEIQSIQRSLDKIRILLNMNILQMEGRIQQEFRSAINAMDPAAKRSESLIVYGKGLQKQIKEVLFYFMNVKEATDIVAKADEGLNDANCASVNYSNWTGGTDRWSTRQVPSLPKPNDALVAEARSLLGSTGFSGLLSPSESVMRMSKLRDKVDTTLYEMELAKRTYERCIQEAILAYNNKWLSKIKIAGPSLASPGQKVTFTAEFSDEDSANYGFRWSGDGKTFSSTTNTQVITASTPGDHVIKVVVWRWSAELNSWQQMGEATHNLKIVEESPAVNRIDLGRVPLKVACTPAVASPGSRVQCSAKIEDTGALSKLKELTNAGGRWGFYWYVNNKAQISTGDSITATVPQSGGADVTVRLMVMNPTVTSSPQEVGRASATLQAKATATLPQSRPESNRKKYGPFAVPWGSWLSTGASIRKGESFMVRATGGGWKHNDPKDGSVCGANGHGVWRWWELKVKIGSQLKDVGSAGGGMASEDGVIELGAPRGGSFLPEDNYRTGTVSTEVWIDHKGR